MLPIRPDRQGLQGQGEGEGVGSDQFNLMGLGLVAHGHGGEVIAAPRIVIDGLPVETGVVGSILITDDRPHHFTAGEIGEGHHPVKVILVPQGGLALGQQIKQVQRQAMTDPQHPAIQIGRDLVIHLHGGVARGKGDGLDDATIRGGELPAIGHGSDAVQVIDIGRPALHPILEPGRAECRDGSIRIEILVPFQLGLHAGCRGMIAHHLINQSVGRITGPGAYHTATDPLK